MSTDSLHSLPVKTSMLQKFPRITMNNFSLCIVFLVITEAILRHITSSSVIVCIANVSDATLATTCSIILPSSYLDYL